MRFFELTATEAEAYRAQVEADGPARLDELGRLLRADGVDLAPFDATVESLRPLWAWFVGFAAAGFPGIAADAAPRTEAIEPQGPEFARAGYAAELLVHYLFEVGRTCFGQVRWVAFPHAGMDSFQRASVQYDDDSGYRGYARLDMYVPNIIGLQLIGDTEHVDDGYLVDDLLVGPYACSRSTAERIRTIGRGPSIFAGDTVYRKSVPKMAAASTRAVTHFDTIGKGGSNIGDELVFAHLTANVEALEAAPAVDVAAVTKVLASLGFRDLRNQPPTAKAILAEEFAEFVRADDAMVTTLVAGGKLRALQIASISPSAAAWAEITEQLAQLAGRMGGRLAPEDEF